ncbi:membrane-associated protein, putative [Bodo saltans]|uniref:Membrane-associated protein, putative n=1 Tax=Bodo saltans TaxID=75058 RepID=A0A0S4IKA1_BODSA|nr:membrane-associated protein, putative [Bodo saltans]|eukprot:CUE56857.1 membrane-associated protein, putative [Bodo saltans]
MDVLGAASEALGLVGAVDAAGGVVSAAAIAELVVIAVMLVDAVRRKHYQNAEDVAIGRATDLYVHDIKQTPVQPLQANSRSRQSVVDTPNRHGHRSNNLGTKVPLSNAGRSFPRNETETQLRALIELICSMK